MCVRSFEVKLRHSKCLFGGVENEGFKVQVQVPFVVEYLGFILSSLMK